MFLIKKNLLESFWVQHHKRELPKELQATSQLPQKKGITALGLLGIPWERRGWGGRSRGYSTWEWGVVGWDRKERFWDEFQGNGRGWEIWECQQHVLSGVQGAEEGKNNRDSYMGGNGRMELPVPEGIVSPKGNCVSRRELCVQKGILSPGIPPPSQTNHERSLSDPGVRNGIASGSSGN